MGAICFNRTVVRESPVQTKSKGERLHTGRAEGRSPIHPGAATYGGCSFSDCLAELAKGLQKESPPPLPRPVLSFHLQLFNEFLGDSGGKQILQAGSLRQAPGGGRGGSVITCRGAAGGCQSQAPGEWWSGWRQKPGRWRAARAVEAGGGGAGGHEEEGGSLSGPPTHFGLWRQKWSSDEPTHVSVNSSQFSWSIIAQGGPGDRLLGSRGLPVTCQAELAAVISAVVLRPSQGQGHLASHPRTLAHPLEPSSRTGH